MFAHNGFQLKKKKSSLRFLKPNLEYHTRLQFHYSCGQNLRPNQDIIRQNSSWDTDTPQVMPEPKPKITLEGCIHSPDHGVFHREKSPNKISPHKSYKADEKVIHHGQESADIDSRFRTPKHIR